MLDLKYYFDKLFYFILLNFFSLIYTSLTISIIFFLDEESFQNNLRNQVKQFANGGHGYLIKHTHINSNLIMYYF